MTDNAIYHLDSLEAASELDNVGDINCIVTDPPYGVDYRSRHATTPQGLKNVSDIVNDKDLEGAIELFTDVMDGTLPYLADECELYVFTRWDIVGQWIEAVSSVPGFKYKMLLIWNKDEPGTGDIDSNWGCGHELILYAKKGLRKMPYRRSGVLHFPKVPAQHMIHPTEKPVPLLETLIEMSTKPGEWVLDLFGGSGSTTHAAINSGRNSIAFEKDRKHYEKSMERVEGLGGFSF